MLKLVCIGKCTSSLYTGTTATGCDEADAARDGPEVHVNNFLLMDIDWDAAELVLSLRKAWAAPDTRYLHVPSVIDKRVVNFTGW